MTWSLNTNWIAASERKGVRVIGIVRLELQKTSALRIDDYSVINGSAMTVGLNIGGAVYIIQEGTDFAATGSNTTTATNIGDALVEVVSPAWIIRYQVDTDATGSILTVILGEAASATVATTFEFSTGATPSGWGVELGEGPTEAVFCKSHEPYMGTDGIYPNLVTDIRGLEMGVDPLTREISLSTPEIDFADPGPTGYGLRHLMRRFMLFGKYVDISIGFEGLAEADFEPWPRLYIQKVRPNAGGAVTLTCGDGLYALSSGTITGEWVAMHPLQVVEDLLLQTVTPDRYDASTLDPTDSAYDSIGHWCVSRYNDEVFQCLNGINDPTQALAVLNSVLVMLNGTLAMDQDGVYGFALLDEDADAVRSFSNTPDLGQGQYACTVTSYSDAFDGLTNSAVMNFAQSRDTSTGLATYAELDRASVRECLRLVETTLDLEWCNAVAEIYAAYLEPGSGGPTRRVFPNTEEMVSQYAPRQGFCGTHQVFDTGTSSFAPAANSELGATRKAFIRLEGRAYADASSFAYTGDPEIVACDDVDQYFFAIGAGPQRLDADIAQRARPTTYINQYSDIELPTQYDTLAYTWTDARFYIDTSYNGFDFTNGRAGFGTSTPAARDGGIEVQDDGSAIYRSTRIVDITIPVDIAKRWLRRTRFGMPKQTVEVGPRHYDLTLGDVVTMSDDDTWLAFQQPSIPTSGVTTSFEVTRKRCRLFEADPCIEIEVSFLRSTAYPGTDVVPIYDPTVFVLELETTTDFVVTNDGEMVTNDQDADGFDESYTTRN